jgi:RNA 2',3'-cyclic 3'-phosphodiesterase
MRLFIGIPIADTAAVELSSQISGLKRAAGNLRWAARESWHITLQFLGNASPDQLDCLKARLREVWSPPVSIEMGRVESFERARILFADVVVTPGLARLQERVIAATSECGFMAEARAFHPHVTLARKAGGKGTLPRGVANLHVKAAAGPLPGFTAGEFLLYESHLSPEGLRYEVRARFALGGARP